MKSIAGQIVKVIRNLLKAGILIPILSMALFFFLIFIVYNRFSGMNEQLTSIDQRLETDREPFEQFQDDIVLAAEVIVEVAGADVRFVGYVVGRDIRLAVEIEQAQAGLQYEFPGVAPGHSFRTRHPVF